MRESGRRAALSSILSLSASRGERKGTIAALALALAAVVGAALFGLLIGFDRLPADAPFWRNPPGDMAAMEAGYRSLLAAPWTFPPTVTYGLQAPKPLSVVYTDSVPWLALLLKAVPGGRSLDVLGLVQLLNYLLQPLAMGALLWALGVRRPAVLALGGALALLTPTWLIRQLGHPALASHWLILLALAVSVDAARRGLRTWHAAGFAALGALVAGVHAYHLPPIAVCAAAAIGAEFLQSRGRRWLACGLAAGAFAAALWGATIVLGFQAGPPVWVGAVGHYSVNLIGPVFPQASALAGQRWNGAWFPGVLDPTGGQVFEGFSYLGAGLLSVMALGLALRIRQGGALPRASAWAARFGPLAVGLAILTLLAIGPMPYAGKRLLVDLRPPEGPLSDMLAIFRAHGRFIWAPSYMLIALALLPFAQAGRWVLIAGLAALGLQAWDVSEIGRGLAERYRKPPPLTYPAAFWSAPALRERPWFFAPSFGCADNLRDLRALMEFGVLVAGTGGTTNGAALGRTDPGIDCRVPDWARRTAPAGDERILLVVDEHREASQRFGAFAARGDCHLFSAGLICGRGLDGVPGLAPAPPGLLVSRKLVTTYVFYGAARSPALRSGWSITEPNGTWSEATVATMAFDAPPLAPGETLVVQLEAMSAVPPGTSPQRVGVSVNGRPVAHWRVSESYATYELRLSGLKPTGNIITFQLPDARVPRDYEPASLDTRRLGLGVKELRLLK